AWSDVLDEGGAVGGAVGLPQFEAVAAVVGREEQRPVDVGQVGRGGAIPAGEDVLDEGGAEGVGVALPQLAAVVLFSSAVTGAEKQRASDIGDGAGVRPHVAAPDVLDEEGGARRRVAPLQRFHPGTRRAPPGRPPARYSQPVFQAADQERTTALARH